MHRQAKGMRKIVLPILIFIFSFQFSGCGLAFSKTRFLDATTEGKIKLGQTTEEIRLLLGNPDSTKSTLIDGSPVDVWVYNQTSGKDKSDYVAGIIFLLGLPGFMPVKASEVHFIVLSKGKVIAWDMVPQSLARDSDKKTQPEQSAAFQGTAFGIGNGYFVTNNHVITGMKTLTLYHKDESTPVSLVLGDQANDVALLKVNKEPESKTRIASAEGLRLGDTSKVKQGDRIWTLGFPLSAVLGEKPVLTEGTISSLYGIGGDPRLFQISVQIQPGNSGGPLLNDKGEVIGITVSTINAAKIFQLTGGIPQNVNFAVKINYAKSLISMLPDANQFWVFSFPSG